MRGTIGWFYRVCCNLLGRGFFKHFHLVTLLWILLSLTYYDLNPSPNGTCSRNLFSPFINSHLPVLASWSYLQAIYTHLYQYQSSFILSSSFPCVQPLGLPVNNNPFVFILVGWSASSLLFSLEDFCSHNDKWLTGSCQHLFFLTFLPDSCFSSALPLIFPLFTGNISPDDLPIIPAPFYFYFYFFSLVIVIQGPWQENKTKQSIYRTL